MLISIDRRYDAATWSDEAIDALARFTLEYMKVPHTCELSISLVGAQEIQKLNREYRGIDTPTDVLSFECDDPWDTYEQDVPIQIGDVVIAPQLIDEQRSAFHTSFDQEASLMLVHSILHLLGYDHMHEQEAHEMESLEKEILEAYGLGGIR